MAKEIDNRVVFGVLIVAIALSVGGTGLVLHKLNNITESGTYGVTGMATSDQGYAEITIEDLLAIDVDSDNNRINFGNCQLLLNSSENASVASHLTESQINSTDGVNCSGSNLPAFIRVLNTGNVDAEINMTSSHTGTDLLDSTESEFFYKSNSSAGCASGLQPSYTLVDSTSSDYQVCTNLTYGEQNSVDVAVNLTLQSDSTTSGSGGEATLTFTGGKA